MKKKTAVREKNTKPAPLTKDKWVRVGTIGVDAGCVWIGDPCYILQGDRPKAIGKDWAAFCRTLTGKEPTMKSYDFDAGHEGLGVVVSSGFGDGTYDVMALVKDFGPFGGGKRVCEIRIVFVDDEDGAK